MKKLLLLLFSSFVFQTLPAQQYYPMLDSAVNIWRYIGNGMVVRPHDVPDYTPCSYPFMADYGSTSMYTDHDTVINSLTYKILIAQPDFSSPCTHGYLREDTASRKIYFLDINGNPELLLYDFSMQVGDTITINFPYSFGGFFQNGLYRLDSITATNTLAGPRRVFNLHKNACSFCEVLSWVESVGNLCDLIYPYSSNSNGNYFPCPGNQHHFGHFMSCFTHNEEVYLDSCAASEAANNWCYNFIDSCTYYNTCGSVPEINSEAFYISPNPSSETFTINSKYDLSFSQLEILNLLGEVVYTQTLNRKQEAIHCEQLSRGGYFVQVRAGEKVYVQKLMIE